MLVRVLPEREVGGIALVGLDLDSMALACLVDLLARELAVAGELAHVVVDGAVHFVGEALCEQLRGHLDHLGDVVGCPRHHVDGGC